MDHEIDWDHLLNMASRHRLMPLLYVNLNSICPEKVPENVLKDLKDFYLENTQKNLLLTSELIKVIKLLEDNGIDSIPYKGPVLAHFTYNNLSLRQFGDIDILISKSDALKVKKLMFSEGYELYNPIIIDDSFYMKFITELQFVNQKTGVIIEIKWKFAGDFFSFPQNTSFLYKNLNKINLNAFEINNFEPVNHILILCIHAAKHGWMRLSWICDINEFTLQNNINWVELLKKSEYLGVKRIILITFDLLKELFGLEVPKEVLSDLNNDKSIINISSTVKKRIFNEKKESLNLYEKFFLYIKIREKKIQGFKDCLNGLTKPGYKDYENLSLSEELFFLYYIIRPFLLIKRYSLHNIFDMFQ